MDGDSEIPYPPQSCQAIASQGRQVLAVRWRAYFRQRLRSISPFLSCRISVPCNPAAGNRKGSKSSSMERIERPLTSASAPSMRRRNFSELVRQTRRHDHFDRCFGNINQRAINIQENAEDLRSVGSGSLISFIVSHHSLFIARTNCCPLRTANQSFVKISSEQKPNREVRPYLMRTKEIEMGRLVVVSNRTGDLGRKTQTGGLAVGIVDALKSSGGMWMGWSGEVADNAEASNAQVGNI